MPSDRAWGPLPYRTTRGSIVFPETGPGGWVWGFEYAVAKKYEPRLQAKEAWVLRGECDCGRPYEAIGYYYGKRLEWGKEGRGTVIKLGLNSQYGKFAQVIGKKPKFACRVLAGVITSTTRGRILEAIASAKDPWSVVYVATDGIISTEAFLAPDPEDNVTRESAERKGKAMLGAWEHNGSPRCGAGAQAGADPERLAKQMAGRDDDVFLLQPGFYFNLRASDEEVKKKRLIKTRGTPLDEILARRKEIVQQWRERPMEDPTGIPPRTVFRGVKTSILKPSKSDSRYRRKASYGRWEQEDRDIAYVVNPKRSDIMSEGDYRLKTWRINPELPESAEYSKDRKSLEAMMLAEYDEMRSEQPDYFEDLPQVVE